MKNMIAASQLARDLDGMAVVYSDDVDRFAAPEGGYRTDLPLGRIAEILKVEERAIGKNGSTTEIEPGRNAVYRICGWVDRPTEPVDQSRWRLKQARDGRPVWLTPPMSGL